MSTLVTNTITGLSTSTSVTMPTTTKIGATAIVSASAGSATIIAEGGTVTTNIQQGLAKAWSNVQQQSTQAIGDSYNITSITDLALGKTRNTFTNNLSNTEYSCTTSVRAETNEAEHANTAFLLTTNADVFNNYRFADASAVFVDSQQICISCVGDLA